MFVLSFLYEIDVGLVVDEEFMASVSYAEAIGIELITVSHVYAVETAADHCRDRVGGTVSHAEIHVFVLVCIYQPCRHVAPVGHAISAHEHTGVY